MPIGTTIAVTVLLLCGLLIALTCKFKGIGPLILVGVILGLGVGISGTLLANGLTG